MSIIGSYGSALPPSNCPWNGNPSHPTWHNSRSRQLKVQKLQVMHGARLNFHTVNVAWMGQQCLSSWRKGFLKRESSKKWLLGIGSCEILLKCHVLQLDITVYIFAFTLSQPHPTQRNRKYDPVQFSEQDHLPRYMLPVYGVLESTQTECMAFSSCSKNLEGHSVIRRRRVFGCFWICGPCWQSSQNFVCLFFLLLGSLILMSCNINVRWWWIKLIRCRRDAATS